MDTGYVGGTGSAGAGLGEQVGIGRDSVDAGEWAYAQEDFNGAGSAAVCAAKVAVGSAGLLVQACA